MVASNNNFEGGVDATAVTAANSGGISGDAFSSVVIGANGSFTFQGAAAAHGALGGAFTTTAINVTAYAEYNLAPADRYAWRTYFRLSALPTSRTVIGRFRDNAATPATVANVSISDSNRIQIENNLSSPVAALQGGFVLVAGTLYRLEVGVNGVTGFAEWSLFAGDSTTPLESKPSSALATTALPIGKFRFGRVTGTAFIGTIDFDDIQLNDLAAGLPGPISNATTTVRPTSLVSNPGVFTNVGGASSLFAALSDELDTTYVQSQANPSGAGVTFGLPELSAGTPTITVRHNVDAASPVISATYSLMQGTTVISTRTVTTMPTVVTDFSWTATSGETALITDRTQLSLRISTTV